MKRADCDKLRLSVRRFPRQRPNLPRVLRDVCLSVVK